MFLEVKNISKKFNETSVLSDASFGIEKGEVVALLGSSGAGKTTLLRCLNFLETPDSGQFVIDGEIVFDALKDKNMNENEIMAKRKHFGLVFQSFNLFPQYTVKQNVTLAPSLQGEDKKVLSEKADQLLKQVGLSDRANYYPCQLSGGQQQRVAIARALIMNPDVLCFDEPTSALDPALVGEVVKVVKELKEQGRAILVVTHDMNFAKRAADRIVFIADGEIVEDSKTEDFFNNPRSSKSKEFIDAVALY
ncbi:MAG: amino acid ABC transporter ATP-binding protein [Erysipelotrichaceae bacterium]|nr:amino acid ABC transporter ATP-binding protein [Erysipelotrichaceae bacterium]